MGSVYGNRSRGRPKTRYSDNVRERAGINSIVAIYRLAQTETNGEPRRSIVYVSFHYDDDEDSAV